MCNVGSFKPLDNLPGNRKGAFTIARLVSGDKFKDLKASLKKPPAAPPAPIAPVAPATPMDSSVLQTEQDVRRAALRRRGTLATLFGGDTGGYRPNGGPSVAGIGQGGQTLGG